MKTCDGSVGCAAGLPVWIAMPLLEGRSRRSGHDERMVSLVEGANQCTGAEASDVWRSTPQAGISMGRSKRRAKVSSARSTGAERRPLGHDPSLSDRCDDDAGTGGGSSFSGSASASKMGSGYGRVERSVLRRGWSPLRAAKYPLATGLRGRTRQRCSHPCKSPSFPTSRSISMAVLRSSPWQESRNGPAAVEGCGVS